MPDHTSVPAPDASPTAPPVDAPRASGGWAPLRHGGFRGLWSAALFAYVAFWMQTVAGAWLMISLHASPLLVALMQTAASLPMFLWSLPAGVLADLFDRRRLILGTQGLICATMALLAVLSFADAIGPAGLLMLTFVIGTGLALNGPAWQAAMSESVPRDELAQALTLVGIAYNIARAVGPAAAGAVQAFSGPGAVFAINAVAYGAALLLVWRVRPPTPAMHLPPERLLSGMRTGLQYAANASAVRSPLLRTAAFMFPASALWALLPVLGQAQLGVSAGGFGVLIGSLGLGAIVAGLAMPAVRSRAPLNATVVGTSLLYALACALVALIHSLWLLCPLLMVAGFAWSTGLTLLNAALLTSVPSWVRSRTIALNLLVTQGSMAAGGAVWGFVATHARADGALVASSATLVGAWLWARRYPVRLGEEHDVTLSPSELQPDVGGGLPDEAGPVAVEIRYTIDASTRAAFFDAAETVGVIRRRNGARFWRLYRDLGAEDRYMERFIVDSWIDYQRQLARSTVADQQREDALRSFQRAGEAIETAHYLAER